MQTSAYDPAEEYFNQQDGTGHHTASPNPSLRSNTPLASPYKVLPAIGSPDTDKVITNLFLHTIQLIIMIMVTTTTTTITTTTTTTRKVYNAPYIIYKTITPRCLIT